MSEEVKTTSAGWSRENCIEFINDSDKATVTFCQGRYISRIKELAEKFPDKVDYTINADGSLIGHIPTKAIHISIREMELSDEQRQVLAERLKASRTK